MMSRALLLVAAMVVGACATVDAQSLFGQQMNTLYQDRRPPRANKVGDILTVLIVESTSASNRANVETSKENKVDIDSGKGTGPLRFIPGFGLVSDATTEYTGEGSTVRQQQIDARVSVTVVGTKSNGDLLIEGSRTIEVNGEREVVYLSGEVDPLIIPANNVIESYRVSNLQVSYKGRGIVSEGSRPGILIRLLNWIF
jgi:flagellar L-ring protein precursor FlgH